MSEEDIVKPCENKCRLLEVDTSQLGQQGQTEVLLQRYGSSASIQKQGGGSLRTNDDLSFSDASFSQDSKESILRQADVYHSYGWEARKKLEFKKAIEFYNKAIELNPSHFKAIFNRGFAYDKTG